jgi:hypothetical protein
MMTPEREKELRRLAEHPGFEPVGELLAALDEMRAILTKLCQQASGYEDEALPEQLYVRIEDLNNRRVKAEIAGIRAEAILAAIRAFVEDERNGVTREVLALLDAAPEPGRKATSVEDLT